MASRKLRQSEREQIVTLSVRNRFAAELVELQRDWKDFAEKTYRDVYGDDLKKMVKVDADWLPISRFLKVKFGHGEVRLDFDGVDFYSKGHIDQVKERHDSAKRIQRRIKFDHWSSYGSGQVAKVYDHDHPLVLEYAEISVRTLDLEEEIRDISVKTAATLESLATIAKIKKEWPEICFFVFQVVLDEVDAGVPAIRRVELNEKLGLPVDEDTAK